MINSKCMDVEVFPNLFSITFVDLKDYLYTFRDFFDNVYIWKTSRVIEDNISKVSGRVKEFITYDGQQEIQLIYCKCS